MEFGKVHCGSCEKELAFFPADNKPKDEQLELYCLDCKTCLETQEDKEKLRQANIGKKHSEESKLKMSKSRKGRVAWNKGLTFSYNGKGGVVIHE